MKSNFGTSMFEKEPRKFESTSDAAGKKCKWIYPLILNTYREDVLG